MAVKKSKKSPKGLSKNSNIKTSTAKAKSSDKKSPVKSKDKPKPKKKASSKKAISNNTTKKGKLENKTNKTKGKIPKSKSKSAVSSKKSTQAKSVKKSSKSKPSLKISSNKKVTAKIAGPKTKESKKVEVTRNKSLKNTKKTTPSDLQSNTSEAKKIKKNIDDWKTKYSFDETEKAGKESIKDIPALIIQPKEEHKDEIKEEKIKDITSSVTSPKYTTSFLDAKTDKEPEGKFEMEFMVRCSPDLLFEFLYTPSGLSEWFCDDVNIRNGVYTFNWNGEISQARLLKMVEDERVRYQWANRTDGAYFEFRIVKDELTGDVSLFITDFADPAWDIEGGKRLWQQQIEKLLKLIGSLY
jgi:uncharacterized protein YndB with AHSA1/START domain